MIRHERGASRGHAARGVFKTISDGVGALWTRHVDEEKLELETKKSKLEAAKWPKFGDIAAQWRPPFQHWPL
jgi:hypothetical protein